MTEIIQLILNVRLNSESLSIAFSLTFLNLKLLAPTTAGARINP